jgi:hypothetical protein
MMVIEPLHALILGEIQRASDSRIAYPAAWSEEKFSASGRFYPARSVPKRAGNSK